MSTPDEQAKALLDRLQANAPKLVAVEIKSVGTVYLRKQTGEDQLKIHALQKEISAGTLMSMPDSTFAAILGAVMLLKSDGSPLFDDAKTGYDTLKVCDAGDLRELGKALMSQQLGPQALEDAEKKSLSSQTSEPGTN
jgi:hypothetical protein